MRKPDGSRVADYEYELPAERIAKYPAERRDESRLLVLHPAGEPGAPVPGPRHLRFRDLPDLLCAGDLLVVNESRVLPARLLGRKPTGARSEVLLLRPAPGANDPYVWDALVRPGSRLKPGSTVVIADDLAVEILDSTPEGGRIVRLVTEYAVEDALERYGRVPLPPYLGREDEPSDRERYQTVYAATPGSVAAPTAGLHFTPALLARLEAKGVERTALDLHVGIGTFRPLEDADVESGRLHAETFTVPDAAAAAVARARARGGRVWAVGTTTVRTLESAADGKGAIRPGPGSTTLFIRPPYDFHVVDCLVTNFHLPRSSLLMLVAALAGYERTMGAYREAIDHGYRFYSYGDAMAVVGRP
jgi:S-adenosylmethionine:tRNA ribosyltransferase-isomerase